MTTADYSSLTPEEWIYHFKKGSILRGTVEATVNRPVAQALVDITEYSGKCFNGKVVKRSGWLGNQPFSISTVYKSGVKQSAGGVNTFFVQSKDENDKKSGLPADGAYLFAAEITGDSKQSKMTSYHLVMTKKYATALEEWANGKKGACPDLS